MEPSKHPCNYFNHFIYLTIYLTILTNLTIKLSIIYLNYCVQYFQFYNIGLYDFSSVRNCSALIKLTITIKKINMESLFPHNKLCIDSFLLLISLTVSKGLKKQLLQHYGKRKRLGLGPAQVEDRLPAPMDSEESSSEISGK